MVTVHYCTCFFLMASSSRAFHIKNVIFIGLLLISKFKDMEAKTMSDKASSYPVETNSTFAALQIKYDVFVSFRGADIRKGFLSHLITALSQKQIFAFVDDKLERGDEISRALLEVIERSLISLIIFSQNYASSRWCLEELVKIVECREKHGQTVIPVFYEIDPSDVRHQKGTFAKAFVEHEKRYDKVKLQIWRSALKDSANLSGFHSSNFRNDAELVHQIVKFLLVKVNDMHLFKSKGLVGIDKPIAHLESLLHKTSEDVRVIGIWGLGGVGKTTIAEEIFNRMLPEYDGGCFLASIREQSGRQGIRSLKKKLFSDLLGEQDLRIDTPNELPGYVERRLSRMKVLVVLDDVNDSNQLETLIGARDWFGSGSRILVTTRDKQVLAKEIVDNDIYKVEALDCVESCQLFVMNAFKQNRNFDMHYSELSTRVVNYAKGIPLVLKVLARHLNGKNKDVWESHLEKLKKMPRKEVHDIMRLSYDDLDREEQNIFLDIGCFFHGLNMKLDYIRLLLKDDYSVTAGIERLKDKALITVSQDNIVSMHEIIQETALEIVRDDPSNQRRFWDPKEIYQLLENMGIEAVRSIAFNLSEINDLQLRPQVFANMRKLPFMNFYTRISREDMFGRRELESSPNKGLYLPQGLESLPDELRYFSWMHYPLESLPTNFSAEKLVILDLPYNRLKKLWDGVKNLENLKVVSLQNSTSLTTLPDLSKARNLEVLDLRRSNLASLHPSISCLQELRILDLGGCSDLYELPSNIHLSSLSYLSLSGCVQLKDFSVTSDNLEELNLDLTGIRRLPSSIGRQSKLAILHLSLTEVESLPESIKNLTRLRRLDISYCWELRTLPELPPSIVNLDASGCTSLRTVLMFPSTTAQQLKVNKRVIVFWNCLNLDHHSLGAIGLDAQINLMKIAYNHLSALAHGYYKDNDDNHAEYVYPGSQVPGWLVHRTKRNYVNIDISSTAAPHSHLLGFIFCFVIPRVPSEGATLRFRLRFGEGEGNITVEGIVVRPYEKILTDHVLLTYDQMHTRLLNRIRIVGNQKRLKIKVTAESKKGDSEYVPVKLKGFGVSPMSASEYHSIIQRRLELGDRSMKSQISHFLCTTRADSLDVIGNASSESLCFPDQKTWIDFSRPIDDYDGCWKYNHHVFTNHSCLHVFSLSCQGMRHG